MSKFIKSWLPNQFLWRLTFVNIFVIALFIVLSSWAIYNTACMLVDGMGAMNVQTQKQFNGTLFQYLWIFSILAILIGSVIHFYITRKLIQPLKVLIESAKDMKQGRYPDPIELNSEGEMGLFIRHFNELVLQLKNNQQHRQKLVSDLSHEFRTPLSNLNGYLNALKDGVIVGDSSLYESLYEESKRLTHMIEQLELLKEWDYLTTQTFTAKGEEDIKFIVLQTVEMFRWEMTKKGISVDLQVDSGHMNVNGDGISQVISNLVHNAIRYYEGSDSIRIVGKKADSDYWLGVSGPGQMIPAADRDRIFDRFYRVDPSRTRDTGGTGLGLAISKEIIEHHQGKIGLKSEGNYYTFWFSLPIQ
ncbi:sensor histidine kinase [Bacillus sp. Marseille-P3661]|uniref:sensor histidine kinase n=1 Tax=Bacillus sp. Marseille-P3661 TaxID=1936234 RepID=UPI000C83C762|nr:HAMP domain-containing sensor histidine kinase [Bacillus sp. Marseille-P3661]